MSFILLIVIALFIYGRDSLITITFTFFPNRCMCWPRTHAFIEKPLRVEHSARAPALFWEIA